MGNKKMIWLGVAFLAGVVLAGRARSLPLLNRLPSV